MNNINDEELFAMKVRGFLDAVEYLGASGADSWEGVCFSCGSPKKNANDY